MAEQNIDTALAKAAHEQDFSLAQAETYGQVMLLAKTLAASGMFKGAEQAQTAFAKILIGRDLGVSDTEALRSLHIVEGKPTLDYTLIGALIKRSGRYDYRIREASTTNAAIEYFEHGKSIGTSTFSIEEAKQAGLTGKQNWQKYPKTMLVSKAMSQGARWFCPDVFGGTVYSEADVDEISQGHTPQTPVPENVIEAEFKVDVPEAPAAEEPSASPEPEPAKATETKLAGEAAWLRDELGLTADQRAALRSRCHEASVDWKEVVGKLKEGKVKPADYDEKLIEQVIQALQQGEVDEFAEAEPVAEAPASTDADITDLYPPGVAKKLKTIGASYVQARALKDCGATGSEILKHLSAGVTTIAELMEKFSGGDE